MARASAKRGGRPRPNARQRGQREPSQPVARTEAAPKRASYEDQLFFTRLRRKTKWVFVLLALAFGIGFVVFGVGTGVSGANLGDFFRDLFGGNSADVPAVADALEKVKENPDDPEALLELAIAYRAAGQNADAATTLEKAVELDPSNADALRQLTAVYSRLAAEASQRGSVLLAGRGFGQSFAAQAFTFPETSGFFGAVGEDPVERALDAGYNLAAGQLREEAARLSAKRAEAFEKLAALVPQDTTVLYQLAQAAADAGQNEKAIEAYRRYLEADPDGEYAEAAQRALDNLTAGDRRVRLAAVPTG